MFAALAAATGWQSQIRSLMSMPEVETARPVIIAAVSVAIITATFLAARVLGVAFHALTARLQPFVPPRIAALAAFLMVSLAAVTAGNDLILARIFALLDRTYVALDGLNADAPPPSLGPARSGGAASLVSWHDLGEQGRDRVSDPLVAAEIAALAQSPAQEPVRIYAGLGAAERPRERARLALAEAIRTGAFDRGTLVIATPTGTGWVDPAAMMPLEVLTRGDVATVSVQYSYLPSWLALLTIPEYGQDTAGETFLAIYGHWRGLDPETRPRLYLFGLSLGAENGDLASDFYDILGDPWQGALWVGPPFTMQSWQRLTAGRNPESPAWLPQYRDGSVVRFLDGRPQAGAFAPWGPVRILFPQYSSDAISFFDFATLGREPDWMKAPRGPDVLPELRWLPVVTALQVGFDLLTATTPPRGNGHSYLGRHYMAAWLSLLSPEGWDAAGLERLAGAMDERGL